MRVAALGAALVAVYALVAGSQRQIDLSADRRFSLAPESRALIRSVHRPLRITVFLNGEGPAARDARFLLARYHELNHLITGTVRDPDADPVAARRLGVRAYATVVLTSGEKRVDAAAPEELELSTAILRLQRGIEPTVCALTGHGEDDPSDPSPGGFSAFAKMLSQNAYRVQAVDLATAAGVPDACAVVVIAGPRDRLLPQEITALNRYTAGTGRIFFLASPLSTTDPNPVIEPLGTHFVGGLAIDPDRSIGTDLSNLFVEGLGSANPVDQGVGRLHFPVAGALALDPAPGRGLTVDGLAATGRRSYLAPEPDVTLADQPSDPHGSLFVAAAADRSRLEAGADPRLPGATGGRIIRARAVVTSGDAWATNAFLDDLGNRRFAVNALAWLTEQEQLVAATSRPNASRALPLTPARQRAVVAVTVVAIPLAIVATGSVPLVRRRRRDRRSS
ncbi:MAG: Gldg family protein [Acidimicrobiales bacterium]